jgi:hypothetical protein
MHAAAIPLRAEPAATRCGEAVEQTGHRLVRTMRGDKVVALKRGSPITFAAPDKYDLALFVGRPIVRSLDGEIGGPAALMSARIREHIGPSSFAAGLLRVRPGTVLDGSTRLYHGGDQPCDLGPVGIEQGEVQRGRCYLPQSSSASRFIAGAAGFLLLIQCRERPET